MKRIFMMTQTTFQDCRVHVYAIFPTAFLEILLDMEMPAPISHLPASLDKDFTFFMSNMRKNAAKEDAEKNLV